MNRYVLTAYNGYAEVEGEIFKVVTDRVVSISEIEMGKHIKEFKKKYPALEIMLKELIKGKWKEKKIQ